MLRLLKLHLQKKRQKRVLQSNPKSRKRSNLKTKSLKTSSQGQSRTTTPESKRKKEKEMKREKGMKKNLFKKNRKILKTNFKSLGKI